MKSYLTILAAALVAACSGAGEKPAADAHAGHAHAAPAADKPEGEGHDDEQEHGEEKKAGGHDHGAEKEGHGEHEGEEGHGHDEVIKLTPEAAKSANIQLAEARRKSLAGGISTTARLTLTQKGEARIAARVPGRVASLEVQLGQRVKKGEALAYLESPELGQTRAAFLSASTRARVAKVNFEREKELVASGVSSEREMREAETAYVAAQADMNAAESTLHSLGLSEDDIEALRADSHYSSRFPIRTPIAGTVLEIGGAIGQSVDGTTPLFTVGELSELWVRIDIFETQLPMVHVGQAAEITVSAVPGAVFRGKVDYVGDIVDEKTRTVAVRVVVPNPDAKLKPGMFASARLVTEAAPQGPGAVVVPRAAVQKVGDEQVVFVPAGDNQFKPVEVEVGNSTAEEIEIASGLEPGQQVVAQGAFILKSELSKESMGEGHSH